MSDEYNGWKNRATWNVALWLGNDRTAYGAAREYKTYPQPYLSLRMELLNGMFKCAHTGDRVSLWDKELDIEALDEMIREL